MPAIEGSRRFLCSYLKSLQNKQKHSVEEITKEKIPLCVQPSVELRGLCVIADVANFWTRPPDGVVKLNTDGSFMQKDGTAGAGMILRRHDGSIILTSRRSLRKCGSALEAELLAFMEGTALAMEWCQEKILIETDNSLLVSMLKNREQDRSSFGHLIMEAREILSNMIAGITKVLMSQNISNDLLAKFGRLNDRAACTATPARLPHPSIHGDSSAHRLIRGLQPPTKDPGFATACPEAECCRRRVRSRPAGQRPPRWRDEEQPVHGVRAAGARQARLVPRESPSPVARRQPSWRLWIRSSWTRVGRGEPAVVRAGGADAQPVGDAGGGGDPDPGGAAEVGLHGGVLLVHGRRAGVLRGPRDALRGPDGAHGVGGGPAVDGLPQPGLRQHRAAAPEPQEPDPGRRVPGRAVVRLGQLGPRLAGARHGAPHQGDQERTPRHARLRRFLVPGSLHRPGTPRQPLRAPRRPRTLQHLLGIHVALIASQTEARCCLKGDFVFRT